jgi:hypothetical protein
LPMSTAVLTSTSTITNAAVVKNQSTMNNQSSTFYPRSSYYFSPVTITPVSAILGATTDYSAPSQKNIVRSLSFLSLTYSLLTIGSLLVKMKLC